MSCHSTIPQAPIRPGQETAWLIDLCEGVFSIEDTTVGAMNGRAIRLRGHFLVPSHEAYNHLAAACRAVGKTVLFRTEENEPVVYVIEGTIKPPPNNHWLPIVCAIATLLSVHLTSLLYLEVELALGALLQNLHRGWGFTLSMIGILLAHELGHYAMARHFGVAVTLPYLIPLPLLSPFGTMGAIIRMKDIPPSRSAWLLIGLAGPIAGLVVAIPVLVIGLTLSEVAPFPIGEGYVMEGNSILYALIKYTVFGRMLPADGMDVLLHPVAFAGWAGLLVTSLNLIPAAQLDGGHIASALLGKRMHYVTWGVIAALLALGAFAWPGWLMWAGIIYVVSRVPILPHDDVSPLTQAETLLAIGLLIVFCLTFTPVPLEIIGQ